MKRLQEAGTVENTGFSGQSPARQMRLASRRSFKLRWKAASIVPQSLASGNLVSKMNLFLVSLVAALPGGVLSYILATNFIFSADKMEGMVQIVSGFTLAMSALVTVLPFGILIFGPKAEPKPAAAPAAKKESPSSTSQAEVSIVEEPGSEVIIPTRDSDEYEVSATESDLPALEGGDDDFQTEAEMQAIDFDERFADEELDIEQEDKPKGKGKGRKR
jgi:hypothetical protein